MGSARSHPCSCDKQSQVSQSTLWRHRQAERKQQPEQHHFLRLGNQQLKIIHKSDQPTLPSPYHSFVASGRSGEPDAFAGKSRKLWSPTPRSTVWFSLGGPKPTNVVELFRSEKTEENRKEGPCQTCLQIRLARLRRSNERVRASDLSAYLFWES